MAPDARQFGRVGEACRPCRTHPDGSSAAGRGIGTGDLHPRFGRSARTPLERGECLKLAERPRLIEADRYPLRRQRQVGLGG
jgi:hypothetical protein